LKSGGERSGNPARDSSGFVADPERGPEESFNGREKMGKNHLPWEDRMRSRNDVSAFVKKRKESSSQRASRRDRKEHPGLSERGHLGRLEKRKTLRTVGRGYIGKGGETRFLEGKGRLWKIRDLRRAHP